MEVTVFHTLQAVHMKAQQMTTHDMMRQKCLAVAPRHRSGHGSDPI